MCIRDRTQAVRVTRSRDEKFHVGKATLDQRAFGIEPYSAMMGTLKIRPDVEVLVRLAKAEDETPRS